MTTTEDVNIRETLIKNMSISMSDGVTIGDAAKIAADWIISTKLAEDFVRDLGPRVIAQYWRDRQSDMRKNAFAPTRGQARINSGALSENAEGSPYSLMWNVPGIGFVLFGDLTKNNIKSIAEYFATTAQQLEIRGKFFFTLLGRLKNTKTVRESISEEELWGLMKQFGVRPEEQDDPD